MQLAGESILEVESFIPYMGHVLKFFILPTFILCMYGLYKKRKAFILGYLAILWFLIPLLVLSIYRGELSDYYYSISRPIAPVIIAFLLSVLWDKKNLIYRALILVYCVVFFYLSVSSFNNDKNFMMPKYRAEAIQSLEIHKQVFFAEGAPVPYLYGLYSYQRTGHWQ